jgi:4-amino-4-deoxy-L-arabinose transferase-like glycosyltransferase
MMTIKFKAKSIIHKGDAINLFILLSIALILGVYLIVTTVLIAKDGVYYIERAQKLSSDPRSVIVSHPPGYPFLIFIAHKFVGLFSNNTSAQIWAYSAQSMTLLCRLLALVPLYFIGKLLIGSHNSFWALLILIFLPYPAEFGSDALRDWPHILFLATGFLFLLWGVKQGKWWMFGITGLIAGLGFTIRPECMQLVIYGILWLLVRLLRPKNNMSRSKLLCALFILLIGLAFPIIPYVRETKRVVPPKLEEVVNFSKEHVTSFLPSQSKEKLHVDSHSGVNTVVNLIRNIIKAIGRLIGEISDNLMYFFVPVFTTFNVIIMILLYCGYGYISRRHCLPLVVLLILYVPEGLEILAQWFRDRFCWGRSRAKQRPQLFFFILLVLGVVICFPKLLRPVGADKPGYRAAAKWLKENIGEEAVVAVPDLRISFYAERKRLKYKKEVPKEAEYIVRIMGDGDKEVDFGNIGKEVYSVSVDKRKKSGKKLGIYRIL